MSSFPHFPIGTILRAVKSPGSAPVGAFALVVSPQSLNRNPSDEYVCIRWLSNTGQSDGHYWPEYFEVATRNELQDEVNKVEKDFEALREGLNLIPKIVKGDFVFAKGGWHTTFPYLVMAISPAGQVWTYRPSSDPANGEDKVWDSHTELTHKPDQLQRWLRDRPNQREEFDSALAQLQKG